MLLCFLRLCLRSGAGVAFFLVDLACQFGFFFVTVWEMDLLFLAR